MAARGWSARETARRAGWAETAEVSNLLRRLNAGGTARADTLEDLARAFGVTLGELVDGDAPASSEAPAPVADDPPRPDEPLPSEMPETLGQRRDYARQEAAAKKELAKRGESVEEWVWPHVRATNNFTLENSAPGVAMLVELAKFIASFGDPSAKARK
jgi:transcriptional regulator with XRE-family HTH domain